MAVTPPAPPEHPHRLFLSYAHENEAVKDRLKINLAPLARSGWLEIWDDRAIPAGADWRAAIETAMDGADAAIFLLEEYFLASNFCMDVEVAKFLQRQRDDGVLILFVLTDHCLWEEVDFIRKFQLLPRDAKPIVDFDPPSLAYTAIAKEIKNALAQHAPKLRIAVAPAILENAALQADFQLLAQIPFAQPHETAHPAPPQTEADGLPALLLKLPGATAHLFGRDAELAQIDAWKNHKGVFLWVADGGTGKSALVRKWLETQDWPAGTRFLGHSFYSQGSHNQATSARGFLLAALKQLAVDHAANAADDELGRLLAAEAAKTPTVLVLDGIEPLQQLAKDDPKLNGMVKDRGLAALLEGLAKQPGQALCLASSRLPIPETSIADAPDFREKRLDLLPPGGARELLRQRGVRGDDAELDAMAERCGFHPLALVLAAEFCHTYLQDRATDFLTHPWQPKTGVSHAATVMAWFDSALAAEHQALDRELARILGLFDRPAPWGALLALKTAAPIPGLTVALHKADEPAILESLARLSQWGLLDADLTRPEPELDAHPLVREHFGALLEAEDPSAWRAAHSVLFDWFRSLPDKEQPDTLEELEPLYRAVGHGCKAGRYRTALESIYRSRILRSDEEAYSLFHLGAYSPDLAALSGFFPRRLSDQVIDWCAPAFTDSSIHEEDTLHESSRSWLRGHVAFCLMSVGRLNEALEPRTLGLQMDRDSESWTEFCISSNNLSDLLAVLGDWGAAERVILESLNVTEKIESPKQRARRNMIGKAYLARILHGQGRFEEASATFLEAEQLQNVCTPETPRLYSLRGYDYAQFLIERARNLSDFENILERGKYALEIDRKNKFLLFQALCCCFIGQALDAMSDPLAARESLDQALITIKRAGYVMMQPPLHLIRAQHLRFAEPTLAWDEYENAYIVAHRGNMRTYLAECALLAGNLCLDQSRELEAAAHYTSAAQLIHKDGYGRRLTELHLLHTRLFHAQHDSAAAPALAGAEARIREVGQWYFWRELRAVAKEIGVPDPGECPE